MSLPILCGCCGKDRGEGETEDGENDMKRTKTKTDAEREALHRQMCDELGDDAVKQLWNAYRLTAAAIVRRAKQRAEAELRETEQ